MDPTKLEKFPVEGIYGCLDHSVLGGGRPSYVLPKVEKKDVENYIEKTHDSGLKFKYLINAPCFGNKEYVKKYREKINSYLQWINDIGTDEVIVSNPYLLNIVSEKFPNLKINFSTIGSINTPRKVKIVEEMGADEITLDYHVNRKFDRLKRIQEISNVDLTLLLNDPCILDCPLKNTHYCSTGHESQKEDTSSEPFLDYYSLYCQKKRLENPAEIVKIPWIRPEDLERYRNLGFEKIKISGRERSKEWLLNTINAYTKEEYKGNLLNILNLTESSSEGWKGKLGFVNEIISKTPNEIVNQVARVLSGLNGPYGKYSSILKRSPESLREDLINFWKISTTSSDLINLQNKKLDGFIDFFEEGKCTGMCETCNYCKEWVEKALEIKDEEKRKKMVEVLEKVLSRMSNNYIE